MGEMGPFPLLYRAVVVGVVENLTDPPSDSFSYWAILISFLKFDSLCKPVSSGETTRGSTGLALVGGDKPISSIK